MHILLIEDELSTAKSIRLALMSYGLKCDMVHSGIDGVKESKNPLYDIILLDMMLPDMDGVEVIQRLRNDHINTPILVLSALTDPEQKVKALQNGADDYMTKPFHNAELLARLRALMKRGQKESRSIVTLGKISIDLGQKIVKVENKTIKLTDKEYLIMEMLISRENKYISREQVLEYLYEDINNIPIKIINVFICRIRKKMEKATKGLNFIHTVWGSGYKLIPEGELPACRKELFKRATSDELNNDPYKLHKKFKNQNKK